MTNALALRPEYPFIGQILHTDALTLLRSLPTDSIDLVVTDPPYYKVKNSYWDNQWDKPQAFIEWIEQLCKEWQRVLKSNGSLYVFASPQMSARVELAIGKYFNVLNNIRWIKENGWHKKTDKEAIRSFMSPWESVIFAEHKTSDTLAADTSGYYSATFDLHKQVYKPLGDYIREERERAGVTRSQVEVALGYVSKSDPNRGTALCYRWEEGSSLPTKEAYLKLRGYLNSLNNGEYLRREYEDLRREYEDLRREYEDLRREYEDLRRPFNSSPEKPFTDLWQFNTVQASLNKHECEKPLEMAKFIIDISSKPNGVVLDTFCGSGVFLDAARQLGRSYIGGDFSEVWCRRARERVNRPFAVSLWKDADLYQPTVVAEGIKQMSLFEKAG